MMCVRFALAVLAGVLLTHGVSRGQTVACCAPGSGCFFTDAMMCAGLGGTVVPSCMPEPCGVQRVCCLMNGTVCTLQTEGSCISSGGIPNSALTACAPMICTRGGCCLSSGSCVFSTSSDCVMQGGRYLGDNVTCVGLMCGSLGACCASNGVCTLAESMSCAAAGNRFYGTGTSCSPTPCPIGACCQMLTCFAVPQTFCSGTWIAGTFGCSPDPCVIGACCGINGGCVSLSAADCLKLDGQFLAGSCAMSPCTVAMGACCKPDDTCVVTSRDMCAMQSGRWNGRGTGCMPATLCCRADFDRNGTLAPGDIFEFLNAWFVGCP